MQTNWLALWWGAFQNEWVKFRRRRRVALGLIGLGILTVAATAAMAVPQAAAPAQTATALRQEVKYDEAGLATSRGTAKLLTALDLRQAQYALARQSGAQLPPVSALEQAAHRVMLAVHGRNLAWAHYAQAVSAWKEARYSQAHHLPIGAGPHPRSGWWLVSRVFSGPLVVLYALLALVLAADVLGQEFQSGTWNRLWLDPPGRAAVLLAKGALVWAVAAGVLVGAALALYVAGTAAFGAGPLWVVSEVTYQSVRLHSYGGMAAAPQYFPVILSPSQVVAASLPTFDVTAVLGSILPLAAILSAAAALGWLVHQPAVAALLAAALVAVPNVLLVDAGQRWLTWIPSTYLQFGHWIHHSAGWVFGMPGSSATLGLLAAVAWIAGAAVLVGWHTRRIEL